ncbi:MAG: hypothetical protein IJ083_03650 [Clostridia bacterium]|nr:hypothetical protein [Clostridia bacterium]
MDRTEKRQLLRTVWLGDDEGTVAVASGLGAVEAVYPASFFQDAASALPEEGKSRGVLGILDESGRFAGEDRLFFRAFLASVLLSDLTGRARVERVHVTHEMGGFCKRVLSVLGRDSLELLCLREEGEGEDAGPVRPLGLVDPDWLVLPMVSWREKGGYMSALCGELLHKDGTVSDPTSLREPVLRRLLIERLEVLGGNATCQELLRDLMAGEMEDRQEADVSLKGWSQMVRMIAGLPGQSGFENVHCERIAARAVPAHPLFACLGLQDPVSKVPERGIWTWGETPLCYLDPVQYVTRIRTVEAADGARALYAEEEILERDSRVYALSLSQKLKAAAEEVTGEGAKRSLLRMAEAAYDASLQGDQTLTLTWPWRTDSPAVHALLLEVAGEEVASACMRPFSDRLVLMDPALLEQGRFYVPVPFAEGYAAVLPPVSESLGALCATGGFSGYGLQRIEGEADGQGNLVMRLYVTGARGTLTFTRSYAPLEQIIWEGRQVPDLSVWPAVPIQNTWRTWYLSLRGRVEAGVWQGKGFYFGHCDTIQNTNDSHDSPGNMNPGNNTEETYLPVVLPSGVFPFCTPLRLGTMSLGAILADVPPFEEVQAGQLGYALDIGGSGTALARKTDGGPEEVVIPNLTRILLKSPSADPSPQLLPSIPLGPVLPTSVLFHGWHTKVVPLVDASFPMPGEEADSTFLLRTDEQAGRLRDAYWKLCMLLCSLDACMRGADAITWHLSLPDVLTEPGIEAFRREAETAAEEMEEITGVRSLGVHLAMPSRLCAARELAEKSLRASFGMLIMGQGSISGCISLRGIASPIMDGLLGIGLCDRLHMLFRENPSAATELPGPTGLASLKEDFLRADHDARAFQRSRDALEWMLGERAGDTALLINALFLQGGSTHLSAWVILVFCEMMTLFGTMAEAVGDRTMYSDRLPEQLPVWFCGRGAGMYPLLCEEIRRSVATFLTLPMRDDHPVHSMRLQMSMQPKMEAAFGILRMEEQDTKWERGETQWTVAPDWLCGHFLLRFSMLFPVQAALLFPGMVQGGELTQDGTQRIWALRAQCPDRLPEAFHYMIDKLL